MAICCGVDIVEIDRIKQSLEDIGTSFRERVFTERESEYCESKKNAKYQSYAARFAAKEAVSKAFGTGIGGGIKWRDIEILNDVNGRPYVVLSDRAKVRFDEIKAEEISLSLSHCRNYAVAYAVIEIKG